MVNESSRYRMSDSNLLLFYLFTYTSSYVEDHKQDHEFFIPLVCDSTVSLLELDHTLDGITELSLYILYSFYRPTVKVLLNVFCYRRQKDHLKENDRNRFYSTGYLSRCSVLLLRLENGYRSFLYSVREVVRRPLT